MALGRWARTPPTGWRARLLDSTMMNRRRTLMQRHDGVARERAYSRSRCGCPVHEAVAWSPSGSADPTRSPPEPRAPVVGGAAPSRVASPAREFEASTAGRSAPLCQSTHLAFRNEPCATLSSTSRTPRFARRLAGPRLDRRTGSALPTVARARTPHSASSLPCLPAVSTPRASSGSAHSIDRAEDRERLGAVMAKLGLRARPGHRAQSQRGFAGDPLLFAGRSGATRPGCLHVGDRDRGARGPGTA
jgi:hypothetical protein